MLITSLKKEPNFLGFNVSIFVLKKRWFIQEKVLQSYQ